MQGRPSPTIPGAERAPDSDGAPCAVIRPKGPAVPVVFDSPHSGTVYPADFRPAVPISRLRRGEDRFVDLLFADAVDHGAVLVTARFARSYVDPNRTECDIDTALLSEPWPGGIDPSPHSGRGVGLVWRLLDGGVPIYDRRLGVAEMQARIDRYWRPYHRALQEAVDAAHRGHGRVWHVNCHSMWSVGTDTSPDPGRARAHFVLGDRDGTSCEPAFTRLVAATLREMGYDVAVNDPYKGAELVARHGHPASGRHSLQIEVNRGLYMDEDTLEPNSGFERVRADLGRLAARIADHARQACRTGGT